MSKDITKAEALERIFHHLRGTLLAAMIKEHREPYMLSLFLKTEEGKIRQAVGDILEAFKPTVAATSPPPPSPPAQRR